VIKKETKNLSLHPVSTACNMLIIYQHCIVVMRSSYRGVPAEPAKLLAFSEKDRKHLESNRALLNPPKDFDLTESHVYSNPNTFNVFLTALYYSCRLHSKNL